MSEPTPTTSVERAREAAAASTAPRSSDSVAQATESIRYALEHPSNVPSKELPPNTELRRAPLLEAQVEIEVAGGNLNLARAAADELSRIADTFGSRALAASAALAHGTVGLAGGDVASARRHFEAAAHLWSEVGAPYETAVARLGLARAHRAEGNEGRARLEFQAARQGFDRVGAVSQTIEAEQEHADGGRGDQRQRQQQPGRNATLDPPPGGEGVFRHEGDYWLIAFEGRAIRVRDLKGLRYLARLLAEPGREFHVLDLVAVERGWSGEPGRRPEPLLTVSSGGLTDVLLDKEAKESYRRRLREIEDDVAEARAIGDDERAAQAEAERDWLVRELAHAVGLGGRDRRVGSASERARASVTRAVRQAMVRIRGHHQALGEHLDRTVRTGTYCAYMPDPRALIAWTR